MNIKYIQFMKNIQKKQGSTDKNVTKEIFRQNNEIRRSMFVGNDPQMYNCIVDLIAIWWRKMTEKTDGHEVKWNTLEEKILFEEMIC